MGNSAFNAYTSYPVALYQQTIWTPTTDAASISSATFANISANLPQLTLSLVVGDVVECHLTIGVRMSAAGNVGAFDWDVDQPTSANTNLRSGRYGVFLWEGQTNGVDIQSLAVRGTFVATEAGTHGFTPQWRQSSGTLTLAGGSTYNTPVVHRVVVINRMQPAVSTTLSGNTGYQLNHLAFR